SRNRMHLTIPHRRRMTEMTTQKSPRSAIVRMRLHAAHLETPHPRRLRSHGPPETIDDPDVALAQAARGSRVRVLYSSCVDATPTSCSAILRSSSLHRNP
ncbi:MAG: hypothetical protein SGPRY_007816, partial [Prymnesium sp.]